MNYFHKYKFSPPDNWCMFIREVLTFASFRSLFHLPSAICAETQTQRQTDTHVHTHRLPMGIVFTMLWIHPFSVLYLPWYWSVTDRLYSTHTSAYKTTMGPCGLGLARLWIWRETKFELCHNLLQRSNKSQRAKLTCRQNGSSLSPLFYWSYTGNSFFSICVPHTSPKNIQLIIHLFVYSFFYSTTIYEEPFLAKC